MGLDIYHNQLTLTPEDPDYFLYVEGWEEDCNVPLHHYERFITTIKEPEFEQSIAIVENEETLEKLKQGERFGAENHLTVFIGEIDDAMRQRMAAFARTNGLDKLETSQRHIEAEGLCYRSISFGVPTQVQVVPYNVVGYQRKGMNALFYETFRDQHSYFFWGKKADFELAYACIEDEWGRKLYGDEVVYHLKKNFKENFLDKFEFGKSLLFLSF